jgi:hypothetical protein
MLLSLREAWLGNRLTRLLTCGAQHFRNVGHASGGSPGEIDCQI